MHRSGHVDSDIPSFLKDWRKGSHYANTKLANVLFTYEAQRRLGPRGIQVSPVAPQQQGAYTLIHMYCHLDG